MGPEIPKYSRERIILPPGFGDTGRDEKEEAGPVAHPESPLKNSKDSHDPVAPSWERLAHSWGPQSYK
jgi:hypothetical protein